MITFDRIHLHRQDRDEFRLVFSSFDGAGVAASVEADEAGNRTM